MMTNAGIFRELSWCLVTLIAVFVTLPSRHGPCIGVLASTSDGHGGDDDGMDIVPLRRPMKKFTHEEQELVEGCFGKNEKKCDLDNPQRALNVVKRVLHEDGFSEDDTNFVFEFFSNLLSKYVEPDRVEWRKWNVALFEAIPIFAVH